MESSARPTPEDAATSRIILDYKTGRPGPCLVIFAAIHGDEIAGPAAVERVRDQLGAARLPLRGRVIGLVGNTAALAVNRRYVDRDLNREWSVESVDEFRTRNPEQDGAEDREQRELLKFIDALENETDQSIVFLDLHSTSAPGLPFACMPDTIENLSIALRIPVPAVLGLEETIRGPLLGWLSDRGFAGIIVEGGQHVDPDTPDILESAIWALLVSLGCLHASEVAYYDEHVGRLEDKSAGLPRVLEVKLRHQVTAADNFVMRRGFKHYDRVHQGQHLADDTSGKIRASISGRILMPAYGENTEQGFFIVRDVNSFKVRILFLLRSLGLDRFCHLLPGVKVNPVSDDILHVAGWVPKRLVDIIRLLGWRRSAHSESSTVLKRRHTHVRLRDG